MFPVVSVVAIDDQQKELDAVIQVLSKAKIPCLPLFYEELDGLAETLKEPLSGVRLVFTDINLSELTGTPDAVALAGPLSEMLGQLLDVNNGPYALIFWSRHTSKAEELIEIFKQRYPNIPAPVCYGSIEKPTAIRGGEKLTTGETVELAEEIRTIIRKSKPLSALFSWETKCTKAIFETTTSLFKLVNPDNSWNFEKTSTHIKNVLSRVSQEAIGKDNAKQSPVEALNEGMLPILLDNLSKIKDGDDESIIADALSLPSEYVDLPSNMNTGSLNSFYHIDSSKEARPDIRGAFVELKFSDNDFKAFLNTNKSDLLYEFINKKEVASAGDIKKILNQIIIGGIEISAECDYAQRKKRNSKYIITCLIPDSLSCLTHFGANKDRDRMHEAIYRFPQVCWNENNYTMKSNFRYLVSLSHKNPIIGQVQFRVRNQILNDLVIRFNNHSSRPGIIMFR